jgi:SNF2 family DNA or RNA helicase
MNEKERNPPIKATLFAHQQSAFETAMNLFESGRSSGYGLLFEMGCGKSLTAISIVGRLFLDGKVGRVLVVAPLSILGVWQSEFAKFADFDYNLAVLDGAKERKIDTLRFMKTTSGAALQVAVINYESAKCIEKDLMGWADSIICDESHKIKSYSAQVSKTMHRLGARAKYKLLLTGTPVTNKAIDLFSQFKFLNPDVFGNIFHKWRNRYFYMGGYCNHTPFLKKSMEPELAAKLRSISYRATKLDCLDLPETVDVVREVELSAAARKIYNELLKQSVAELAGGEVTATNILTKLLRLCQVTGGFVQTDGTERTQQVGSEKLKVLEDIIESTTESGQKIVIIARFVAEIKAICKLLESKNLKFSCIYGETKDRTEQVAQFQNDDEVSVFVGQIATAGLGITLTAASTMAFYSLDYNMANFEQAKARIHRVGQKNACTYYYLVAANSVDGKIMKALQSKVDLAKSLVDAARQGENPFV